MSGERALFVIDNDFGALGTVMYLLHGQALHGRATVLLPQRAHDLHHGHLPVESRPYRSAEDILGVVDEVKPHVVCLFSGYVLALQGVLSVEALRDLVGELRRRGCKVATSDPFLGTFPRIMEADLPTSPGTFRRMVGGLLAPLPGMGPQVETFFSDHARKRLQSHVRQVVEILDETTHVYPVPVDGLGAKGRGMRISFANLAYLRPAEQLRAGASRLPSWLFILAKFDLEFQERTHGKKGFRELVARRIREALDNGRSATFIGPAEVTEALSIEFGANPDVSLLPYCAYQEFERRLLEAEYAFYWQIFSSSTFLRLWNGLPVFFFDPGHNAHLLVPMQQAGLEYYYLADPPIYLGADHYLEAATLASMSQGFRASADESRRRLAELPTPAGMIEAIAERG